MVRTVPGYITKEDDFKLAKVTMVSDIKKQPSWNILYTCCREPVFTLSLFKQDKAFEFTFPDITTRPGMDIMDKSSKDNQAKKEALQKKFQYRPGLPSWFVQ